MNKWLRLFGLTLLLASLSACAGRTGLYHADNHWRVLPVWQRQVGFGTNHQYLKLTPAVVHGRIYAADSTGQVVSIDLKRGLRYWLKAYQTHVSAPVEVSNNMIFLGGMNGVILALDTHTGKPIWASRLPGEVLAKPVEHNGVLLVKTVNDTLMAFNAVNGKSLWRYHSDTPSLIIRGSSAPVVVDNAVIAGFTNGQLVKLSLQDGEELWKRQVTTPKGTTSIERMVDIDADPVVEDGLVYWVNYQGALGVYSLETGESSWEMPASSVTGLVLDDHAVYVTDTHSHCLAYDKKKGTLLWRQNGFDKQGLLTAPILFNQSLVVADSQGYVHWLNKENGRPQTSARMSYNGGFTAPPQSFNDKILVMSDVGQLILLKASLRK